MPAANVEDVLACPVCLALPPGEIHQCNNGHCYCASCWSRLPEPRRCPECRVPLPPENRSQAQERAVREYQAQPATCKHCQLVTTRGELVEHVKSCPQRPASCCAAGAGCAWTGMQNEKGAHEAACVHASCHRAVEPLRAENAQLRGLVDAQKDELERMRPLVASLEGVSVSSLQALESGGIDAIANLRVRVLALERSERERDRSSRVSAAEMLVLQQKFEWESNVLRADAQVPRGGEPLSVIPI